MADTNAGKTRKSKRLALTDISNVVQQALGPSAPNGKRLKTGENSTTLPPSPLPPAADATTQNENDASASNENEEASWMADSLQVNTSTLSAATTAEQERELELYGYIPPKKIKRKFALRARGADPVDCFEVLDDIYGFYHEKEDACTPRPDFKKSKEIEPRMRTILMDWLIEVHYKYKLHPPTLWLCVNIIDRYFERVDFPRDRLQLVGITALLIACKFEEFRPPAVQDFVTLTDSAYQQEEILSMEFKILETLDYELLVPTTFHFLQRYLHRLRATELLRLLASFFAERNIQEPAFFLYKPHMIAAASVFLALKATRAADDALPVWSDAMVEETGLQESDLLECAGVLVHNAGQTPVSSSRRKLEAVRKKYSTKATLFVANTELPVL